MNHLSWKAFLSGCMVIRGLHNWGKISLNIAMLSCFIFPCNEITAWLENEMMFPEFASFCKTIIEFTLLAEMWFRAKRTTKAPQADFSSKHEQLLSQAVIITLFFPQIMHFCQNTHPQASESLTVLSSPGDQPDSIEPQPFACLSWWNLKWRHVSAEQSSHSRSRNHACFLGNRSVETTHAGMKLEMSTFIFRIWNVTVYFTLHFFHHFLLVATGKIE